MRRYRFLKRKNNQKYITDNKLKQNKTFQELAISETYY